MTDLATTITRVKQSATAHPDIVYVFRGGATTELRYSLRSLAANLPHGTVWISGGHPQGIHHIRHIPIPQDGVKYANSGTNLRAAVNHPEVADTFLLFNDDFFITEPLEVMPTLNRGPLETLVEWHEARYPDMQTTPHPYTRGMRNTLELLRELGHPHPLSYELHVPMLIDKAKALRIYARLDKLKAAGKLPTRIHWRTVYGNLARVGGSTIEDVKVYGRRDPAPAGPFVSTHNSSFRRGVVGVMLRSQFPARCVYEK